MTTRITKTWFVDGQIIEQEIPEEDIYLPDAQGQEPVDYFVKAYKLAKELSDHLSVAPATPQQNKFNPDWDAMAVMVEEQQRMAKRIEELEAQRKPMHEMLRVQGCDGTWNFDPYMHGMYNGMEYMLAMVENREPVFRDAPDKWLNTLPPASIASEAHDIKENT